MKILYISGPFSPLDDDDNLHGIKQNILTASRYALMAARKGWMPFTPHKNTADFQYVKDIEYEFWLNGCIEFVRRSDAILMIPEWEKSFGAVKERVEALNTGIPVFYYETGGIPEP